MRLSAEHLNRAKKDLEGAVAAFETGDDSNVSAEGRNLVEQLAALNDVDLDRLRSDLKDSDLRNLLDSVRERTSEAKKLSANTLSPIVEVGGNLLFDFNRSSLIVRLHFEAQTRSFESIQDLEDTLWIGAAVVELVKRSMREMDNVLSPEAKSGCIGEDFEERLKQIEDAVGEVRQLLTSIHASDALGGKT